MRFLRYVGEPREEDTAYASALQDDSTVVLDSWSSTDDNVEIHFVLGGQRATVQLRPHTRDLFDLGAAVYVADEILSRSTAGDRWSRQFSFVLPVVDRPRWEAAAPMLRTSLSFLSGDAYEFEWLQRPATAPEAVEHRTRLAGDYDAICLFSGGVDSLLGAATLLDEGQKVLLVGHYVADGVTPRAQRDLFQLLVRKYPGRAALLQVNIERSRKHSHRYVLPQKVEITHRSRSFLFLAVGAAITQSVGASRLFIPENGLIAINVPLGPSRQGTLSTRTAHPRFIEQFNNILGGLGIDICVQNPFSHESKTDMVRSVTDPVLREALGVSVSCAHAGNLWREGGERATHCGYCVPCLYRRAAFLAAGIDESGYLWDVFTDLPNMTNHTARDFRLLTRFALSMQRAKQRELVAALVRHGAFAGGADGAEFAGRAAMLRRWAASFVDLVTARATRDTRRIVGL